MTISEQGRGNQEMTVNEYLSYNIPRFNIENTSIPSGLESAALNYYAIHELVELSIEEEWPKRFLSSTFSQAYSYFEQNAKTIREILDTLFSWVTSRYLDEKVAIDLTGIGLPICVTRYASGEERGRKIILIEEIDEKIFGELKSIAETIDLQFKIPQKYQNTGDRNQDILYNTMEYYGITKITKQVPPIRNMKKRHEFFRGTVQNPYVYTFRFFDIEPFVDEISNPTLRCRLHPDYAVKAVHGLWKKGKIWDMVYVLTDSPVTEPDIISACMEMVSNDVPRNQVEEFLTSVVGVVEFVQNGYPRKSKKIQERISRIMSILYGN